MATEYGRLIIQLDDQIIQILELSTPLIKIGRLPDNEVSLPANTISRVHLEHPPRRPPHGQVLARQTRQFVPGSIAAESTFLRFLPDIHQDNDFLRRFLLIFESIWEPLEGRQNHIEMYLDPRTCPTAFLPWLASWLDLPYNPRWSETRIRRLLAQGMELYQWRGTKHSLIRMIEVCTSLIPTITDVPGQAHVFRIQISLTATVDGETVDRALIEDLIETHKPAHTGYILEVIE